VSLFLADPFTEQAESLLRTPDLAAIVADWAVLEVSNVVSRRVRIRALTEEAALTTLANFDLWRGRWAADAETTRTDVDAAIEFVRRFDLLLRGPDAIHIAIAQRLGASLCTFDARMATAAAIVGLETAPCPVWSSPVTEKSGSLRTFRKSAQRPQSSLAGVVPIRPTLRHQSDQWAESGSGR
jgi:predicted nucleic acid-binding protein